MKKIILATITAIMALSVFVGCSYKAEYTAGDAKSEITDLEVTVENAKISGGYWDEASGVNEDEGAFYLNCGDYASYTIKLDEAVDLSDATITISIKTDADGLTVASGEGINPLKVAAKTTDTMISEYGMTDTVEFIDVADLTSEEYAEYSFKTTEMWTAWSADGSIKDAYLPYIDSLLIQPQNSCKGIILIDKITIKAN